MRAVELIRMKRDGQILSPEAIHEFVRGAATNDWPDYQLSAMLMAIFLRGMNDAETAQLTQSMTQQGKRYRWDDIPGPKVDKHSTGGVGDKTSLILAPIAASCGVIVPMMSGRGLGHSGGTLDKLEAIPGFRVSLSEDELHQALKTVGVGMIGQSADVAPADKKLYALRDVTATVECIPLITASILSKKLAEGIDSLVMDIKVGRGAFMKSLADAELLAKTIVSVGNNNGVRTEALLTRMDAPLGLMVGNALEVKECIDVLKGSGPRDTHELSVLLAAHMIQMAKQSTIESAIQEAQTAITSGRALEVFRKIVMFQGGDARVIDDTTRLPTAPKTFLIRAKHQGVVTGLDAYQIGLAATLLGAGRTKATDTVDPGVGIRIINPVHSTVTVNEPIFEVHYRDDSLFASAIPLLESSIELATTPLPATPLVISHIT